ncbi:hypothetical protein DL98DRAFT_465490 [Cadophora sp. DSE1049]|nr:hypothetical protein DL98DRAFT_465490 [Cadophora sp. DSE1049]
MTSYAPALFSCANTGDDEVEPKCSPCDKKATNICTQCFLVQCCSRDCQKAHWSLHKPDCKSPLTKTTWKPSWETEKRKPAFMDSSPGFSPNNGPSATVHGQRKYLWGNMPAFDVLNLKQNEGADTTRDFRLLFAASGDLRNAATTVAGLPSSYTGQCELILNDIDTDIVVRNAILLLVALIFDPEVAAPMMLHLWYSALIPAQTLRSLQEKVAPLIQEVYTKIQGKAEDSLQAKTWTYGSSSLRIVLKKSQWRTMLRYFQVPEGLSAEEAQKLRKTTSLAPERIDYLHRGLFILPPASRVGMMKFRSDGILLPFGASRKLFDTPNPTVFQSRDFWPMMDWADPLHGWSTADVRGKVPLAKNDLYGGLFFHVHDLLLKFCERLKSMKVAFTLFQVNALELPEILRNAGLLKQGFDRVEVSNISDGGFVGIARVLFSLSLLLRLKTGNPHSTLITLFLNAIHEVNTDMKSSLTMKSDLAKVSKYLPRPSITDPRLRSCSAALMDWIESRIMFWDFDKIFGEYMLKVGFEEMARETGMCMKKENTVIEAWPLRLRGDASQREFDVLRSSSYTGCERYVEWKRA